MIDIARRAEPSSEHTDAIKRERKRIQQIVDLAEHLAPADRMLIRSMYERGINATELARAAGLHPEVVRRRARRLLRRLRSPIFQYVLERSFRWPRHRRDVARHIFLHGNGQRETAAALGLSLHEIRKHAQFVQAAFEQTKTEQEAGR